MFPLPGCEPHGIHPLLSLSLRLLRCGTAEPVPVVMAMAWDSPGLSTLTADVAHQFN